MVEGLAVGHLPPGSREGLLAGGVASRVFMALKIFSQRMNRVLPLYGLGLGSLSRQWPRSAIATFHGRRSSG